MKPRIIIVDEPSTGQDWRQSIELMELLSKLNKEWKTIIFLTHHMRYVAEYTKRTIVIDSGKIFLDTPTREAFTNLKKLRIACAEPPPISILTYEVLGTPALTIEEGVMMVKQVLKKKIEHKIS